MNDSKEQIPSDFSFEQNYPNPFNPTTTISFSIPAETFVIIKIYDNLGNEISTLINDVKKPGKYHTIFDAAGLSSGIYYCKMMADNFIGTQKLILLK